MRQNLVATALLTLALATGAQAAAPSPERLAALVALHAPEAVALRHELHRHPELSNREHRTAALVAERLRALGLEVTTGVAHTGVVGVLRGGVPGPTVAVRADMDALPVTEQTDLPFASTVRTEFQGQEVGVAHACGHDVHTAVQLGLAAMLADVRDELPGTVVFVFQPAEEGPPPGEEGGARLMLAEGALAGHRPAAIFALHSWPDREVGEVEVVEGATWAAVDRFRATLEGKQAHGANPHLSVDPVVMAAQAVLGLQTIRSRTLDPRAASVVTVGVVRGGERWNIIPAEVVLEGTVRTYEPVAQDTVERRMGEILAGVAAAAGGSARLDYERITPATVNDAALHPRVTASLARALGEGNVHRGEPTMAGEDFAYFTAVAPAYYFRLGTTAPGTVSGGLHTPTFRADDGAVAAGMRAMAQVVVDSLQDAEPR